MTFLLIVLLTFYLLCCFFLIFIILMQSGKGGGLSSLGASSEGLSEALGATGADKALNRMTTWSAVGFMVLAILISIIGSIRARQEAGPIFENTGAPAAPISAPRATMPTGETGEGIVELPEVLPVTENIPATENAPPATP